MKHLLLLLAIILFSSKLLAKETTSILIKGGNDSKILINIKNITGKDLSSFNLSYKIKKRVKEQLEDTQLFTIKNLTPKELFKKQSLIKEFSSEFFKEKPVYSELTVLLNSENNNMISAKVILFDLFTKENIIAENISFPKKFWHRGAAQISDLIYQHYTGLAGYINTRLVFISERGSLFFRSKKVAFMDLYGDNIKYVTDGNDLVLTPRLSPDAQNIVYISYKSGFPILYKLNLTTEETEKLFDSEQMIYAPRFSQDGKMLVLASSYEGNSEIITYDIIKKRKKRLTNNYAIDTSPDFSPDGKKIVFSSDRTGAQKLYLIDIDGKNLQEINLGPGNYATPNWSPDGKYIAFTKIHRGKFHIGILNMHNFEIKILTKSYKDEAPTWAPNSKFIIFSRKKATNDNLKTGTAKLIMVNLNGQIVKTIDTPYDASEADWVKISEE
ncbi:MAG: hypothetical protein ACO2XZ_05250 [Rickettsiales bacterium]